MDELFNVNEKGEVNKNETEVFEAEAAKTVADTVETVGDTAADTVETVVNTAADTAETVANTTADTVETAANTAADTAKTAAETGNTVADAEFEQIPETPRLEESGKNQQESGRYYSKYDQYRKQSPYEDRRYGTTPTKPKNKPSKKDTLRTVGFVAGLAVVFALMLALIFTGASMILKRAVKSSSRNQSEAVAEQPEEKAAEEVVIGNQDSVTQSSENQDAAAAEESNSSEEGAAPQIDEGIAAEAETLTAPEVVKKIMPSMVSITNVTEQEYQNIFGQKEVYRGEGAGSGIIVGQTEEAYLIATNNHVIDNSTDITVTFEDETTASGEIKGSDVDYDLAIVAVPISEVSEETQNRIRIVSIGDSDSLMLGEPILAIGNAMGYGQSVTQGIVSALGRQVTEADGTVRTLIQTDASINPGNSGGALVNMRGELIGINEQKDVGVMVEGIGYAIPMSIAKPILTELGSKTAREVVDADQAGYLGISCMTMPSQYTMQGYPAGAYISEVVKEGPADKAGVKPGDIITAMDGVAVSTKDDVVNIMSTYSVDETITLSISRLNEEKNAFEKLRLDVVLGSKKEAGLTDEQQQPTPNPENGAPEEGGGNPDSQEGNQEPLPDFDEFFGNDKGFFDFFG